MKNLVKNVVLITFFMSFIPLSYSQENVEEVVVTANKKVQTAQEIPMNICLLYTSPSPRDATLSRMPSSA